MTSEYRIVVGVDGSPAGQQALRWAAAEAAARGGTVRAIHVWHRDYIEPSAIYEPELSHADQLAEQLLSEAAVAAREESPGVEISTAIVCDTRPARVLIEAAEDAELLVLGSHGHSRVFHTVLGSTADYCIRKAPCPVVVIPAPRIAPADPPAEESGVPAAIY